MKIIKIKHCKDCPHYTVRHPESYGTESHCRIGQNFQEPPNEIPAWCSLENASYTVTITKCIECANWFPADSHGTGTYCDDLQKVVSDDEQIIPDVCPKLANKGTL